MDKLDTIRIRKHPGGLRGFITTFRIILLLLIIKGCIFVLIAFAGLITSKNTWVSVRTNHRQTSTISSKLPLIGDYSPLGTYGIYNLKEANFVEKILFSHMKWAPDLITITLMLLTYFYLYRIFKQLDLNEPFSLMLIASIKSLGWVCIVKGLYSVLQSLYVLFTLHNIPEKIRFSMETDRSGSIITGIVILIIAEVYRRGYLLKQEKDLTI